MRWWLKGCPRCRGDLYVQYDLPGSDIECLQCGYLLSGADEQRLGIRRFSVTDLAQRRTPTRQAEETARKAA